MQEIRKHTDPPHFFWSCFLLRTPSTHFSSPMATNYIIHIAIFLGAFILGRVFGQFQLFALFSGFLRCTVILKIEN